MILLTGTSDLIQLITSGTANTDVHASYVDNSSGNITPGRLNTQISTATTTTIVGSPGASTQRAVKLVSIRNRHASAAQSVTVQHTDGTTVAQLIALTLAAGEELQYDELTGWKHFDSAGSIKFNPYPVVSDGQLVANTSGGTASPVGTVLSAYLDYVLGSVIGAALQRDNVGWRALGPGSVGQVLTAEGSGNPILWADAAAPQTNIVLNPSIDIDQVNEGAAVTTSGVYPVDAWNWFFSSANGATFSAARAADGPPGFANSLKLTCTAGATLNGTTDFIESVQWIEANLFTGSAFGTASAKSIYLGFWAKSSIANYTACFSLQNANGTRSYIGNFTITAANTWQFFAFIIPGDTSGTWTLTGNGKGALLSFAVASGTNFQTTAGAWTAGNLIASGSITNTFFATNATFQITGIDFKVAATPSPFVRRNFGDELRLCLRLYEKSYALGIVPGTATIGNEVLEYGSLGTGTWTTIGGTINYKASKRSVPTVITYSCTTGATGKASDATNSVDLATSVFSPNSGPDRFVWSVAMTAGANKNIQFHWSADSRF